MRLLVFGGSFDPVHAGHLAIADAAQAALAPDCILWLPSGHAPHKPERPPASGEDRAAFLEVALSGRPGERIDRRELERPGPSYTVDTLEELRREQPAAALGFLAGADSLAHLATWRALPRLFELVDWWFAPRPGWGAEQLDAFRSGLPAGLRDGFRAAMLPMEEVGVSSSAVRAALEEGREPVGVPAAVLAEIRARGSYRG